MLPVSGTAKWQCELSRGDMRETLRPSPRSPAPKSAYRIQLSNRSEASPELILEGQMQNSRVWLLYEFKTSKY